MDLDLNETFDSIKDGISQTAQFTHEKTSEFHEKYVSKIIPDFGKYGDAAKFVAEMAPGVSEYNAIKDGDWVAFAIAAGVDIAAIAIGAYSAGAGYAAVKGGTSVAKTGVKVAAKEVAEAGAKKVAKEVIGESAEKLAKEAVEVSVEKIVKETVETGVEKVTKETIESATIKVVQEATEKTAKEIAEAGTEKVTKEAIEASVKEVSDNVVKHGDGLIHRFIECRNQGLEGTHHPITGVEFVRKTVDNGSGELVEGVFPKFDSVIDVKIPKDIYESGNATQFKKANEFLCIKLDESLDLRKMFDDDQIKQIADGFTPDGYVWHHNEENGVLQLVDYIIHEQTGHTGGRSVWGGGY